MRRFRFSLLSALIFTTVVAVLLSLTVVRARRQRDAVAHINRLGGYVGYMFGEHYLDRDSRKLSWLVRTVGPDWFYSVVVIELRGVADEDLKVLRALPSTRSLTIESSSITQAGTSHIALLGKLDSLLIRECPSVDDRAVAHLRSNSALRKLGLIGTAISDDSLSVVGQLPNLEFLSIPQNDLTDRGVESLRSAKKLRVLQLADTDISDTAAATLVALPRLENLYVNSTAITDSGLQHLGAIPSLRQLDLMGTHVSEEAVARFIASNPEIKVRHRSEKPSPRQNANPD